MKEGEGGQDKQHAVDEDAVTGPGHEDEEASLSASSSSALTPPCLLQH